MNVAEYIIRFLASRGVTHVFELSGGMITPLLDAAAAGPLILVDMRHEQAAGFAAEGMARMSGVPGVAFATSGPGATNLLTAIASCYFDSTPAVFITGQVPTHELKGDRRVRQLGFQETDIVSIAKPITKGSSLVGEADDIPGALEWAFCLATEGRPSPTKPPPSSTRSNAAGTSCSCSLAAT
jgi:acetolactate synthase-1/2/3 large subunit